jgi:hypothetical protein
MFWDVIPCEIHTVIYMYAHPGITEFLGTMAAILKMAAILELLKAIKIVEDNYPLQSGHKFTTNNEVSLSF